MNKMMSVAAFAAALTLTASCALAATADAKIVAPNTEKITAPFAGTLLPFDYETGDSVSAHETLFTLDTTPVYATQAGTVSAVFASVGDDASGVAAHYGALAVIEPKNALYIDASTDQAFFSLCASTSSKSRSPTSTASPGLTCTAAMRPLLAFTCTSA